MGSFLFDLSIRVLNAAIGGFIGFALLLDEQGDWRRASFGIEYDNALLITTVGGAAVGFIWGTKL